MKIAVVIPALNEQKTIANVVYTVRRAGVADEIIVVSDGSTDHTALAARRAGAHVIDLPHNIGKGGAMAIGVHATKADVLLFLDADLRGLRAEHVCDLLAPVKEGRADMTIGVTDRWRAMYKLNDTFHGNVPLVQLTGQRALKRAVFEDIPEKLRKGFQIEEALNYHCKVKCLSVITVDLQGVHGIQKTTKYNFFQGVWSSLRMYGQILKVFFKVRFLHLVGKL